MSELAVHQVTVDLDPAPPVTANAGAVGVTVETITPSASVNVDSPSITVGVQGPQGVPGPPGQTGMVKVAHGSDPNVARPDAPVVYWVGTVNPSNADPDDLLLLKET